MVTSPEFAKRRVAGYNGSLRPSEVRLRQISVAAEKLGIAVFEELKTRSPPANVDVTMWWGMVVRENLQAETAESDAAQPNA
jgi:hypothetical protein